MLLVSEVAASGSAEPRGCPKAACIDPSPHLSSRPATAAGGTGLSTVALKERGELTRPPLGSPDTRGIHHRPRSGQAF